MKKGKKSGQMKTQMKAQMSLEMVIGLLILLVVAAVVIRIFLQNVGTIGTIDDLRKANQYKEFKQTCDALCNEYQSSGTRAAAAKYCSTKFKGVTNLKQDILNKPIESDTKAGLNVCPDAIYCFHAQECQTDAGVIDWADCRAVLCQAYVDTYGDYGKASQKVMELIPTSGSCVLPQNENWYTMFGFGPNPPCGGIVTGTTTTTATTASVTCSKTTDTSVTCSWTCPNDNPSGTLAISGTNQAASFASKTGSQLFSGLSAGTKYNVGLVCDIPDAKLVASYSITI